MYGPGIACLANATSLVVLVTLCPGDSSRQRVFRLVRRPHRKRESQHHVTGCGAWRIRLRSRRHSAGNTTAARMAAHRKLDQRRDDICAVALRKCASAASDKTRTPIASPFRLLYTLLYEADNGAGEKSKFRAAPAPESLCTG